MWFTYLFLSTVAPCLSVCFMKLSTITPLRLVLFQVKISLYSVIFAWLLNSSIKFLVALSDSCVVHGYQQFHIRVLSHAFQAFFGKISSSVKKLLEILSSLPTPSWGLLWTPQLAFWLLFHCWFWCQRCAFHRLVLVLGLLTLALGRRHLQERVFCCKAPLIL